MPDSPDPAPRAPVRADERALAPDLARGVMLLLIAVANTPFYLWGRESGTLNVHPADGSLADQVTQTLIITGVDGRVYPMFAFLFGYGMVQLLLRQEAAGVTRESALALLRRRNLWLIVFGLVHALLLWIGDILGAYGLAGLVLASLFLRRSDRTLLTWAGLGAGLLAAFSALAVVGAIGTAVIDPPATSTPAQQGPDVTQTITDTINEPDPIAAALGRLAVWPFIVFAQGLLTLVVPVAILLGFWAARLRILEEPRRHVTLLLWVSIGGIAIGWLGGLPNALHHVGVLAVPDAASWVFSATQPTTGLAGGIGYAALFGVLCCRLRERARYGFAVSAVAAVGKRSLSCYLAQSVLCAPVLAAWGLGLGAVLGSAQMAGYAVATWLATVLGCVLLERAGRRGPAEVLLRRLSYRRPGSGTTDVSRSATR